jgi:hypothetical protein
MKKLLAASSALALVAAAAPAMAAEVGINVKTRTYNESGTRIVSYTGNTVENDFGLEAAARGSGASAVATGSYVSGASRPMEVTGSATAPGGIFGTSASVDVDSFELNRGSLSDVTRSGFTDTVSEITASSFSF